MPSYQSFTSPGMRASKQCAAVALRMKHDPGCHGETPDTFAPFGRMAASAVPIASSGASAAPASRVRRSMLMCWTSRSADRSVCSGALAQRAELLWCDRSGRHACNYQKVS